MNHFVSPAVQAMNLIREIGDKVFQSSEPIRQCDSYRDIRFCFGRECSQDDGYNRGLFSIGGGSWSSFWARSA